MLRTLLRACFLAACFLLSWPAVGAATDIGLAGATATWRDLVVTTNSVCCGAVLVEAAHSIVSTSEVDSCLSLLPDWGAWSAVQNGSLDVWIEAVGDGSNVVSVLLGDPVAPVLTLSLESDWAVLPGGTLPPDEPAVPRFGITTNRLHIVVRPTAITEFGRAFVETQASDGLWTPRPDLAPANLRWLDAAQEIPNWSKVGVWTAGPRAALTDLRLRWCVDGTVIFAL